MFFTSELERPLRSAVGAPERVPGPEEANVPDRRDERIPRCIIRDPYKTAEQVAQRPGARGGAVATPDVEATTRRQGQAEIDEPAGLLQARDPGAVAAGWRIGCREGADLLERHSAPSAAVARPQRAVRARGGHEQQTVIEDFERGRIAMARSRAEIADPPLVPRRAVALPQLAAGDAVVGAEEEAAVEDRHRRRVRAAPPRADVRHPPGTARRAIGAPHLQTMGRIGGAEVGHVPVRGTASSASGRSSWSLKPRSWYRTFLTGPIHSRSHEEGAEGYLRGLCLVLSRLPRSRGQAQEGKPGRRLAGAIKWAAPSNTTGCKR